MDAIIGAAFVSLAIITGSVTILVISADIIQKMSKPRGGNLETDINQKGEKQCHQDQV